MVEKVQAPSLAATSSSTSAAGAVDRLPFVLPDFTRHSWVGERARIAWEPRIERICQAWADVEWLSVFDGVRRCALLGLSQEGISRAVPKWTARHLSASSLSLSELPAHPGITFVLVGDLADVNRARDAWAAHDDDGLGQLLGYPACCRRFFHQVWVEQRSVDTTWAMAANTAAPEDSVVTLDGVEPQLANILWRWIGVRAVPHLPCRFACAATVSFGKQMLDVAARAGYADEAGWIREMLSWPVEWSGLHGIGEIKTPVLKVSARTDATARKYTVRWTGTGYPDEGATGLRFPYRPPARRLNAPGRGSRRALELSVGQEPTGRQASAQETIGQRPVPERTWFYLDNGFSSRQAMDDLHRPIVAAARRILAATPGNVLDLGCGNGALLAKICTAGTSLVPYGVDSRISALTHAAEVLPGFSGNFYKGDLFDCEIWAKDRRYLLAIVMAGRLLEVEPPAADRLLSRLQEASETVLFYCYPGAGSRSLGSVAAELGLELRLSGDANAIVGTMSSYSQNRGRPTDLGGCAGG
jgi:hypothetical protein